VTGSITRVGGGGAGGRHDAGRAPRAVERRARLGQGAAELAGRAVALGRPLRQGAHHDRLELGRHARLDRAGRRGLVADLLHRDGHGPVAVEGHPPGEHLVEDDADRVAVAGRGHLVAARLLGRQVLGGADDRPGLGHVGLGARPGDAEVGHLQVAVLGDEHVLGLHVAVHHVAPVGGAERGEDLLGEVDRLQRGERGAAPDHLLEVRPRQVLHDDVVAAVRLAAVVDRDDVGVVEAGRRRGLAAEALHELGVRRVWLGQHLDRDLAVEQPVVAEVDARHATGAELAAQLVAPPDQLAGLEAHRALRRGPAAAERGRVRGGVTAPPAGRCP
jgi:hypothetical protein